MLDILTRKLYNILESKEVTNIEDRRYKVYAHINKLNGKFYIGMTGQSLEMRSGKNGINYCYNQYAFSKAIQKYGWNNFEHIILINNLTKQEAEIIEGELIAKYRTQNPKYGYNSSSGIGRQTNEKDINRNVEDYSNYHFVPSKISLDIDWKIYNEFSNKCKEVKENPIEMIKKFMMNFNGK